VNQPIATEAELRNALTAPEREHLEFKSAENNFASEDLFKYCVALSNEGGGNLVLGITDKHPRKIVGTSCFPEHDAIKSRLLDTLKFRVDVFEINTSEGRVLAFYCPPRPIGTPRAYQGRYMMRSGESLVPMTPEVLERIFAEALPDYSQHICEGATLDDLSQEAITEFRARWIRKSGNHALAKSSDAQLLSDALLINNDRITYAALVLLGKGSRLTRLLPQAELIFEYRLNGASIEYQDRVEYRAGFFLWANDIWQKINSRNEKHSYRDGLFRYEIPAFNEDVVREALLNAVTHREYRDGRSIFVRHYPNRLEITSPGGFPSGVTEANIVYRQHPRNRRIAEALQYCGLVERSGQGADRMFSVCIQEGKNRPSFTGSDESQVYLTLDGQIRDPRFVEYLDRLARERNMSLTIDDFLVLDVVREGQPVPADQKNRLYALVEQGVVEKAGRGRGVKYVLSHALYQHVGQAGTYTRRKGLDEPHNQQLVLQHITHCGTNGASMTECEQVLPSKTRPQISALLKRLKEAGKVRVEGKTKGARWFLVDDEQRRNN
jgi:ATP-dependent DNA helicase RecG